MTPSDAILWPGTKLCERLGFDPQSDAALICWMVNTLVFLAPSLTVLWIVTI